MVRPQFPLMTSQSILALPICQIWLTKFVGQTAEQALFNLYKAEECHWMRCFDAVWNKLNGFKRKQSILSWDQPTLFAFVELKSGSSVAPTHKDVRGTIHLIQKASTPSSHPFTLCAPIFANYSLSCNHGYCTDADALSGGGAPDASVLRHRGPRAAPTVVVGRARITGAAEAVTGVAWFAVARETVHCVGTRTAVGCHAMSKICYDRNRRFLFHGCTPKGTQVSQVAFWNAAAISTDERCSTRVAATMHIFIRGFCRAAFMTVKKTANAGKSMSIFPTVTIAARRAAFSTSLAGQLDHATIAAVEKTTVCRLPPRILFPRTALVTVVACPACSDLVRTVITRAAIPSKQCCEAPQASGHPQERSGCNPHRMQNSLHFRPCHSKSDRSLKPKLHRHADTSKSSSFSWIYSTSAECWSVPPPTGCRNRNQRNLRCHGPSPPVPHCHQCPHSPKSRFHAV
eukprot:g1049.t1